MEQVLGDSLLDLFVCFFSCVSTRHLQFWPQTPEFRVLQPLRSSADDLHQSHRVCVQLGPLCARISRNLRFCPFPRRENILLSDTFVVKAFYFQ